MNQKDTAEKLLEDYNDVFADIVNTLLFKGRELVKEDALEDSKINSMYKAEDGKAANKKLVPVVTIVLYFGITRWNQPKSLKGILDIPKGLEGFVSDYKINVFEIAFLPEEIVRGFKSDFKLVAEYFTNIRKNPYYIPEDENEIKHVDAVLKFLSIMSGSEDVLEKITVKKEREVKTMVGEPLSQLYYKGVNDGLEQGMERGIEQGLVKGVNETLLKVYFNCRNKGMTIEETKDIVHFADKESLEAAEEEYQKQKES